MAVRTNLRCPQTGYCQSGTWGCSQLRWPEGLAEPLTFFCVGHPGAPAVFPVELPAVEGALEAAAHHAAPHGQVGPQVRAVSVHHMGFPIGVPEDGKLLSCRAKKKKK